MMRLYILVSFISILNLFGDAMGQVKATKVCQPDSIKLEMNYFGEQSDNKISFYSKSSIKISLPDGFDSSKDYLNYCLENVKFDLVKTSNPTTIIKTQRTNDIEGMVLFENLEYLTEYEVKPSHTIKGSSKVYDDAVLAATTCFGKPSEPRKLQSTIVSADARIITWEQPTTINADKVCYYVVRLTDKRTGKVTKYQTKETKFNLQENLIINTSELNVLAYNDKDDYDGNKCYVNVDASNIRTCYTYSSTSEVLTLNPKATTVATTTKKNGSSGIYSFSFISLISVFLIVWIC